MMNYNSRTIKAGFIETVHESTAEQSLDADISLPDYCPEIIKILKCSVEPDITSVSNNSGRITADVSVSVRLLYVGENGKVSAYEQNYPVQKFIESNRITSDSAVSLKIRTDYANCRAVNPRRVDVRAMMTFIFRAVNKREEHLLCGADGCGIQTVTDEENVASLCGINERAFSLSEVVNIPDDRPSVNRIVSISPHTVISELRVINNKALLKGDCNVKIYYLSDESSSVEYIEHSVPISQILELDGLNENCKTGIKLSFSSCEAAAKADSSGDMRLVDFNARINAFITAFEEIPVSFITDAYSTLYETKNTFKNIELMKYGDDFDVNFTNKVVLESIGVSVNSVMAVWCTDLRYDFSSSDDKCNISGTYQANILYKDNENQTGIIQKPVDFDYSLKMNGKAEKIHCNGYVQIVSCSCAVTGDSRLEMKTELSGKGMLLYCGMKKYISSIELLNENKKKDNCALTICFCDKGENLWNIARKYNTTVEAVRAENDIECDVVEENCMLLIPSDN